MYIHFSLTAKYQHPDEETVKLITDVGFATFFYSTTGVYHYRVRNSPVCSVIVSPGEKVCITQECITTGSGTLRCVR